MSEILNPYYLQIVMFFIINAIMGISIFFTLSTGQLTLGAAGFMSVGAYVGALLTLKAELPIPIAIFIGGVVAALVAVVIGLPTTRLKGLYLAIATLGFGEVVRVIFLNLEVTHGALGLSGIPAIAQELTNYVYEFDMDGLLDIDALTWGNLLTIVILLVILAVYLSQNSVSWVLLILLSILVMLALLGNLLFLHKQAPTIHAWIYRISKRN